MNALQPLIRLVDDDPTVLESQSFYLRVAGWVVKTYRSAETFLQNDNPEIPGCLVLDIRMPGMSGLELQDSMMRRGNLLPIIFLSAHGDIEMAVGCVQKGAFDFLVKPPSPEKLQDLVSKAVRRHQELLREQRYKSGLQRKFSSLTQAESEVARLLAKGLGNPKVAELLGVSQRTVQTHRARVYEKLEVENAVELAQFLLDLEGETT